MENRHYKQGKEIPKLKQRRKEEGALGKGNVSFHYFKQLARAKNKYCVAEKSRGYRKSKEISKEMGKSSSRDRELPSVNQISLSADAKGGELSAVIEEFGAALGVE